MLSVFLCPTNNRGHTGGGKHLGSFLLLWLFYAPPSSCGDCLLSREGFGRPYPSSTPKLSLVYSRSFSAINRFPLRYDSEKNKTLSPRFEPVTWLIARTLWGYQQDHRSRRRVQSTETLHVARQPERAETVRICSPRSKHN